MPEVNITVKPAPPEILLAIQQRLVVQESCIDLPVILQLYPACRPVGPGEEPDSARVRPAVRDTHLNKRGEIVAKTEAYITLLQIRQRLR